MDTKKVIIFILGIILLAILLWPKGKFKISRVENGNTITLDNGTTVKLIGVYDTEEAKEFMYENFLKVPVVLFSDESNPFNPNHLDGTETVYAYVVQKSDAQCINSTLIRTGLTALNEAYLSDSLKPYRRYYELAKKDSNVP